MKRAFLLKVTTVAAAAVLPIGAPTARACQYCRQAYEDPDAGRMVTDNRGGSFSLDGTIGQYQAPPLAADLKTAPAPGSVATSAGDLAAPGASTTGSASVVHRPVLPPPPEPAAPVPVAKVPAVTVKTPVSAPGHEVKTSVAYWSNVCLLGLAAAGGIFCWRTRRKSSASS